jgi:transcriptional regulator with XRE-family HTH domain
MAKLTVAQLALQADVAPNTITRVEADKSVNTATLRVIQAALEAAGIEFTNGEAPGVRLRALWGHVSTGRRSIVFQMQVGETLVPFGLLTQATGSEASSQAMIAYRSQRYLVEEAVMTAWKARPPGTVNAFVSEADMAAAKALAASQP